MGTTKTLTDVTGALTVSDIDRISTVWVEVASLHLSDTVRIGGHDPDHVARLVEVGPDLPPIVVHGPTRRVIDGNHRVRAAMLRGEDQIEARVVDGDDGTMLVLGVCLNIAHGLPLTLADRKAAAREIIRTHPQWSDRSIARTTGLAARTVAGLRAVGSPAGLLAGDRLGRDGRVRPVDRASRRMQAADLLTRHPHATLRAIATIVGISPETVRDVRMRLERGEEPIPAKPHRAPAPGAVGPSGQPVARDVGTGVLRADPTLRYSESGRALIRLLEAHRLDGGTWQMLLAAVPPHCADTVAAAARACAENWLRFADEVGRRSDRLSSSA